MIFKGDYGDEFFIWIEGTYWIKVPHKGDAKLENQDDDQDHEDPTLQKSMSNTLKSIFCDENVALFMSGLVIIWNLIFILKLSDFIKWKLVYSFLLQIL